MTWLAWGVFAWVALQLAVGLLASRRVQNETDYLLAGRTLGYALSIFTIFATWFGAETCIGAAGAIYENGLSGGSADPFGYALALLFMGLVFALPLWRRGLMTLADLFRERFSPTVEKAAVLLMVPTSLLWAAAQVRAFGEVIASVSTFPSETATGIAAAAVVVYTVRGGMFADAVTDLVQGIVIVVGLLVLGVVVVMAAGGPAAAFAGIEPERLHLLAAPGASWIEIVEAWTIPIAGSVIAQELVARVLAARSPQVAQRATVGAAFLYLSVGAIPVLLGLIGARLLPGLDESEQLLPRLAEIHLPALPRLVFLGAVVSAILSTVNSTLLVSGTLTSHNVIAPLRPDFDDAARVKAARVLVIVYGGVAYAIAQASEGVHELVQQASAFGSAGLFVITVFGLAGRFGGPRSALAALVSGLAAWIMGAYLFAWPAPYLTSLACAALGYLLVAPLEARR